MSTDIPLTNVQALFAGLMDLIDDFTARETLDEADMDALLDDPRYEAAEAFALAQREEAGRQPDRRVIDNVTELYIFASSGYVNTCVRGELNTMQTRKTADVELAVGQRMIVERVDQGVMRLEVLPCPARGETLMQSEDVKAIAAMHAAGRNFALSMQRLSSIASAIAAQAHLLKESLARTAHNTRS